jgi:hypothetical protein
MDISIKQLSEELKTTTQKLVKLSSDKLSSVEQYVKDGTKFITEEGIEKIKLAIRVPLALPDRRKARAIKNAPNPRWLYCKVAGVEEIVPVAIPRRLHGRLMNKQIYVHVIKDANGGVSYRHETLGD